MRSADFQPKDDRSSQGAFLEPIAVFPVPRKYRRADDAVEDVGRVMERALHAKRVFDVMVSAVLLLLLSPVFLLIMILISLDSPGGPFFRHKRIGLHGRTFRIFKFRTMRHKAHKHREQMINGKESERLLFKHKNDPRITRFGRFLRKYSLDELPQLINVLKGEMSLIGPRPLLKEDFSPDAHPSPLYRLWVRDRHRLWPGITGLWQVSGRNELTFEESMQLDLYYMTHWTPGLDILILCKTPLAVLQGKGAY